MRVEVVAVGTELLLGQIADTNGQWLGEHLAAAGVDSHYHQVVGDNQARAVLALRTALSRSDAVIVCGGLGPTHDDLTREAIAEVMDEPLEMDQDILHRISSLFEARGRKMSPSNISQANVPRGATVITQMVGTAPGLICPVGNQVLYAVPGVPHEMMEMFTRSVLPDLLNRMAETGETGSIASRVIRTWGMGESDLADLLAPRIEALDSGEGRLTLAFLASGMEGIKIRLTAKATDHSSAVSLIQEEEALIRQLVGDSVFAVDDETMESTVADLLDNRGWSLGLSESLTGGLVSSRLVGIPGASRWFRGSIVSYSSEVKRTLLDVPDGPVVSAEAALAMARGARRVLSADVGLSLTGVAGPEEQDGQPVGTVFVGLELPDRDAEVIRLRLSGGRKQVREIAAISSLDLLRRRIIT